MDNTVAITGASGLLGQALTASLQLRGQRVVALVRRAPTPGSDEIHWNPAAGVIDAKSLEGVGAVVHLAGENIASGRWTPARKARIHQSRVQGTALLAGALAKLTARPEVFVSASAVGVYGDRGDEALVEESPVGSGFLADVCKGWELAASGVHAAGIRNARIRLGAVISPRGGLLARVAPLFRLGLGGRLGSGSQYMSWISLEDAVRAFELALVHPGMAGAVNVVAPQAVTNAQFTQALAEALHRPAFLPAPAFLLKGLLGEMADALLLASQRVIPAKLDALGFEFRHPELSTALAWALA